MMDKPKRTVFISHRWKVDKWTGIALQEFLESKGYEVWIDHFRITAGHHIHDRISHGLDNSDFFIIIWTENANESAEILEEIVRADERRLPMIVLRKTSASEMPKVLADKPPNWRIDFEGDLKSVQEAVLQKLKEIETAPSFNDLGEANRLIRNIAETLKSTVDKQGFMLGTIRDLIVNIKSELSGLLAGRYSHDIGPDRNYLVRATALFEYDPKQSVYAVSLNSISKFWTRDDLPNYVNRYIAAQPPQTIRLFVFADRREADNHRPLLFEHYEKYGKDGAVLVCSRLTYEHLAGKFVTHTEYIPRMLQQDFALLKPNATEGDSKTLEVLLSKTHVQVREILGTRYAAINHKQVEELLKEFKAGTQHGYKVARLDQEHFERSNSSWDEMLKEIFPEPTRDVYHFVFFDSPEQPGNQLAGWLSVLKHELCKKLPSLLQPAQIWIGKRTSPAGGQTIERWSRPEPWQVAQKDFVVVMQFKSAQHLDGYYQDDTRKNIQADFYSRFDQNPDNWQRYISASKFPGAGNLSVEKRDAILRAVEAVISQFTTRFDYRQLDVPSNSAGKAKIASLSGSYSEQPAQADGTKASNDTSDQAHASGNIPTKLVVYVSKSWNYLPNQDAVTSLCYSMQSMDNRIEVIDRLPGFSLDRASVLLMYQSQASLMDKQVQEELVRADEQRVIIVPIVSVDDPAQRVPSFLSDVSRLEFPLDARDAVKFTEALERELRRLLETDKGRPLQITNQNRDLIRLAKQLHEQGRDQPFKAAVIRHALSEVNREIEGLISSNYYTDIGIGYGFLQRAGEFFAQADRAYAVSFDQVSKFWTNPLLRDVANEYLQKQPETTVRLFVFRDAHTMHAYREVLARHYQRYGKAGAVLICSADVYTREFLPRVRVGSTPIQQFMTVDFGVLVFGTTKITAALRRSQLTFQDVTNQEEQRLVDAHKVIDTMSRAQNRTESGYAIYRADDTLFSDSDMRPWQLLIRRVFAGSNNDMVHLAFVAPADRDRATASQRARAAYNILLRMKDPLGGPNWESSWLGRCYGQQGFDPSSGFQQDPETVEGTEYVMMAHLLDEDQLRSFYEMTWNGEGAAEIYKALDLRAEKLFKIAETAEVNQATQEQLQREIVAVAKRTVQVVDYRNAETFESVFGENSEGGQPTDS